MTAEIIIWRDAHSSDEWISPKDFILEEQTVISIGLVVREDEMNIAMSGGVSRGASDDICSILTIPKLCIIERILLMDEKEVAELD